jgi:LacI family transcriptional regulator
MSKPKLITRDQPENTIGEIAVKYLIDEINHKAIEIKTNLIIRKSSFNPL